MLVKYFQKMFHERNEKLEYLVDLEKILLAGNPGVVFEFEILISFYKCQSFYIISVQCNFVQNFDLVLSFSS